MNDELISRLMAGCIPEPAPAAARTDLGRRTGRDPIHWTMPGLHPSARIKTSFGDLPVQALRKRDPIRTVQGTFTMVERVDQIQLDEEFLTANPDAQPIRIPRGTFGTGRPLNDLIVSPHQKVNVSPGQFRQDFRLARDLLDMPGVTRQPAMMLDYYIVHCATPAAVEVEGVCVSISP